MNDDRAQPPASAADATPAEIAAWIGGALLDAERAPARIAGVGTLDRATGADVSFVVDRKKLETARASNAGLLIVPRGADLAGRARIEVDEVWAALGEVMRRLHPEPTPTPGVHPTASIGHGARLGREVSIGAHCSIGAGATIGDGAAIGPNCAIDAGCAIGPATRLHSNVSLQGAVEIGARCRIHSGVVLGADGFKFERVRSGIVKIPQVGRVVIEDDVEIGANACVDRAFLYETRIGAGTKIDNLVQVGHNVTIGRRCLIAAAVAIGGSTTIEDDCAVGGGAAFAPGVRLGRGSMVGGRGGVTKSFPPGSILSGTPARPLKNYLRAEAHLKRLPKLVDRLAALEGAIGRSRGR